MALRNQRIWAYIDEVARAGSVRQAAERLNMTPSALLRRIQDVEHDLGAPLFERHSLQPVAREIYGQAVAGVEHLGSFACRNIYGRVDARRSQHASANALDIAAFRLADGRRVVVAEDWNGHGDAARFLRAVRDGACGNFDGVLGPDYNRAHHDHFHLDLGGWQICR